MTPKEKQQAAWAIQEQVIEIEEIGSVSQCEVRSYNWRKDKWETQEWGSFKRCRYDKDGRILLRKEEPEEGKLELITLHRSNEWETFAYGPVLEAIEALIRKNKLESMTDYDMFVRSIGLSINGEQFLGRNVSDALYLLRACSSYDPKYQALYNLAYLSKRIMDVDFWLSLKGYRYFTMEGKEPKCLEPVSEPQAEGGEQPTETRGQGGLIKVSEDRGKIIVWARAHSVIEIRIDGE